MRKKVFGLEADEGNIWVLSSAGLQNEFVRTMFQRYEMSKVVPAKWILNGYVQQIKEDEHGKKEEGRNNSCREKDFDI